MIQRREQVEQIGGTFRFMTGGNPPTAAMGKSSEVFLAGDNVHKVQITDTFSSEDEYQPGTHRLVREPNPGRQVYEVAEERRVGSWNNHRDIEVIHTVVIDNVERRGPDDYVTTATTVRASSDGTPKGRSLRFGPKIEFTPIDDELLDRSEV